MTGAELGLPTKQVPNVSKGQSGTRWSSAASDPQWVRARLGYLPESARLSALEPEGETWRALAEPDLEQSF